MTNHGPYKLIGVAPSRTTSTQHRNAPTNHQMAAYADRNGLHFVIRYYPTRKGWMVLDVRNRRRMDLHNRKSVWVSKSLARHPRVFPSEDAAVMWAMHQTGIEITQ